MTGHPQADAAKPSTVNLSSKEVVTLGGDPSPPLSHPPGPAALSPCLAALLELARHVNEAHNVTHLFCDKLIALIPRGGEFDVQIAKQDRNVPLGALVPCGLDVCQHRKIVWWDVASHHVIMVASRHHHEGDDVWSPHTRFLNLIEFVRSPEEGNPSLLDADSVGSEDTVITQKSSINAARDFLFPSGSQNQLPSPPLPSRRTLNLHFNLCGCCITQPQRTCNNQLVIAPPKPSTPWDFYVKLRRNSTARPRDYATVTTRRASPTPPPRRSGQSVGAIGCIPFTGSGGGNYSWVTALLATQHRVTHS